MADERWDGSERRNGPEDTPPEPGERQTLQDTARELGHWQGRMEGEIAESKHRLDKINGSLASVAENLSGLLVEIAGFRQEATHTLQTRDKRRATVIGAVSATAVGVAVFLITKWLGA